MYFRLLLRIFFKMESPIFTAKISRNIWRLSHPHARVACIASQLHCAITNRATERARVHLIPECIFEHAQKPDAAQLVTIAEVMFSHFVAEHNLPPAVTGPSVFCLGRFQRAGRPAPF